MQDNLNQILEACRRYYELTDDNIVGVGYGFKTINGVATTEKSIVFTVEKKINISNVPESKILPKRIEVGGLDMRTDVVQGTYVLAPATCAGEISAPTNRNRIRPLRGGLSISNYDALSEYVGTLGFIAVDSQTFSIVGVTNGHVVISDQFAASERSNGGASNSALGQRVIQPNELENSNISNEIGVIKRYLPIRNEGYNYADVAIFTLKKEDLDELISIKQEGLNYNFWLPFATTEEIDNLINSNPDLYFSGRTSGARGEGDIKLKINQIGVNAFLSYNLEDSDSLVDFSNCIQFVAYDHSVEGNPRVNCPINPGDSGSALIAEIGGLRKIVGLVFAAEIDENDNVVAGLANRIDDVADLIGLYPWDGDLSKPVDDVENAEQILIPGLDSRVAITSNEKIFWQVGSINALDLNPASTPDATPTPTVTPTETPTPTPTPTRTPTPTPTTTTTYENISDLDFDPNYILNITSSGVSAYTVNGVDKNGIISGADNADLNFYSGSRVRFKVNALGHNFYIKNISGTGAENAAEGVLNNGTDNGIVDWVVPQVSAPTTFYYNCQYHSSMSGSINISPLAATDITRPLFDSASFSGYPEVLPDGVSRDEVKIAEPYLTYINQAIARWSNYIKFNPAVYDAIKNLYPDFSGISLNQECYSAGDQRNGFRLYNDPTENTIAYCGLTGIFNIQAMTDVQYNAVEIYFAINDSFRNYFTDEEWVDILTHELGHGLGIGQLWAPWVNTIDWNNDEVPDAGAVPPVDNFLDGTAYTNCNTGYKKITSNGINYVRIPLEDSGGSGTSSAHFENNHRTSSYSGGGGADYPGLENELMLGTIVLGGIMKISPVTIGALVDFGYQEVNPGNNEGFVSLDIGSSSLTSGRMSGNVRKVRLRNCCDASEIPKCLGTIRI